MNDKVVFGVTGLMGSGKGTVAAFAKKHYGADVFRFSTMLRDLLSRLYLPHIRENMQGISTILRARFGQDTMARVMFHDIEKSDATFIIVEGIRRKEDVSHLRNLPGFKLIAITVSQQERFERIRKRSENPDDTVKTWEDFLKEEQAETEVTIPAVMDTADITLSNEGSLKDLEPKLKKIFDNELAEQKNERTKR